jgi:anti-sigma factor RsiW
MSPCERVDLLVSAYLEREASPAEMKFVDGHLTVCPRCRQSLAEVARLIDQLAHLPRIAVAPDFTERVLAQTRDLAPAGLEEPIVVALRPFWSRPGVLAAAALLAVSLVSVGLWRALPGTQDRPVAGAADEPAGGFAAARRADPASPQSPPEVTRLPEVYPELRAHGTGTEQSIGMSQDAYVLEDWMLRQPAGGGTATLTRVGVDPSSPVTVTF